MKFVNFAFYLTLTFFSIGAAAQSETVGKKDLISETLGGSTFVYIDGSWGAHAFYLRTDGTFKVCGTVKIGCDEGKWSLVEGKLVRVYSTWFATRNFRPNPITVSRDGRKGVFGNLSAEVFDQNEALPQWVSVDPRK
jgi:hypothetical protein